MSESKQPEVICTWCGSQSNPEKPVVMAPNEEAAICKDCNELVAELIENSMKEDAPTSVGLSLKKPKELLELLNKHIIGQSEPKRRVALAVYNHFKRLKHSDLSFKKSNLLMLGPTGSGKTLVAETIANALDVPFAIADASSLTASGYVGNDVETVLKVLIQNAGGEIQKAEQGIVFIDEIDKICKKGENASITRDVSGEDVQQALLKLIEGSDVEVQVNGGGRRHPNAPAETINTRGILFICAGAFPQLEEVRRNKQERPGIGFSAGVEPIKAEDAPRDKVTTEDLIKCGLIPELIGRLPVVTEFDALEKPDLERILKEPENSLIDQYRELLDLDGVSAEFTDDYIKEVASLAFDRKTGARGLRSIVEDSLQDLLFDAPEAHGSHVIIDKGIIEDTANFHLLSAAA